MNKSLLWRALVISIVFSAITYAQEKKVYSEDKIIYDDNEQIVYSTYRSDINAQGLIILSNDNKGIIVTGEQADDLIDFAAQEIQKYIRISMGNTLEIKRAVDLTKDDYKNNLIILGHSGNNSLLKRLKVDLKKYATGQDGVLLKAVKEPFSKNIHALVIGSEAGKGVLNGAYAFLNRAISIEWLPPRIHRNYMEYFVNNSIYDVGYYRVRDEHRFQIETYVERRESVLWPESEIVEKPVARDLGMIYDKHQFRKAVIDWSVKNRLNTIVLYVDIHFPLHVDESNRIKEVIQYAHQFGVKVHFFTFTHVCSKESREQFPEIHVTLKKSYQDKDEGTYVVDNPKTLEESTKLMVALMQEYDIDGIGWHPASERIDRTIEEGKPVYYWETVYITAYYHAVKKIKPDAQIFMVLGWEYMNPPDELIKYIPQELIAWIVPSRAWTRQYMDDYVRLFPNVWFWLYPWYSTEGVFPHYIIERMQKSVQEAAQRKVLGIVPEAYTFRNHEMNTLALAKLYWNPDLDAEKLKKEFNDAYYYHDPKGHSGFLSYSEGDYWGAYKLFKEAYLASNNPMVRDRLKDMAISSLRLIADAGADAATMYKNCLEAEETFKEHYISNEETDLFYIILQEITQKWRNRLAGNNEN